MNDWKFSSFVTEEQRVFAWYLSGQCRQYHRTAGFNGGRVNKYLGLLGEIVFCDLVGKPRPVVQHHDDGGNDVEVEGQIIDLKTAKSTKPAEKYWKQFLSTEQTHREGSGTSVYVFANFDTIRKEMEFLGWIRKVSLNRSWVIPKGTKIGNGETQLENYAIPIEELQKFNPHTFPTTMSMFPAERRNTEQKMTSKSFAKMDYDAMIW